MYTTVPEVRDTVVRDTTRLNNTTGALSDDQITLNILNAQAQINGKLRGRYAVPFDDPAPELVHFIALDIASYLATLNYRQEKDIPDDDPAVRRYERACTMLCKIADGEMELDGADEAHPGESAVRIGGGLGPAVQRTQPSLWDTANFGIGGNYGCSGWWE